jgi:hypothetical protein
MTCSILAPHARMRLPPRRQALLLFLQMRRRRRPVYEGTIFYRRFTDFFDIKPTD